MSAASETSISISTIQLIRKAALVAVIAVGVFVVAFGDSRWSDEGVMNEGIELTGFLLIAFCIVGRTWCSLYIGGMKNKAIVSEGPYSIARNPLYVFSVIGAAGIGAQLGSMVIALAAGLVTWTIFYVLIFSEERHLQLRFGVKYKSYKARVPRFWPKFSLWHDSESLTIKPYNVRVTFIDACVFLLAIPIAEGFDYLHDSGIVPVLFRLP
jgi:protein-S-isoprenylcysteine O-methyltransferase Ste14